MEKSRGASQGLGVSVKFVIPVEAGAQVPFANENGFPLSRE